MNNRWIPNFLALLLFVAVGADDSGARADDHVMSPTAQEAGCVVDCPPCDPGQICQRRPCRLICPDNSTPCGDSICRDGEVCCNSSCGICAPIGGSCTQEVCESTRCVETQLCVRGSHWSSKRCACVENEVGLCNDDADCQVVSDYCTGCDCRALSVDDATPACGLPGVRCFADPCNDKNAVCVAGQCRLQCVQNQACARGTSWSSSQCACISRRQVRMPRAPHRPHQPHRPHAPR